MFKLNIFAKSKIMSKLPLFIVLIAALVIPSLAEAQFNQDGSVTIYKRDFQYGASLHTRGFSINTRYTKDIIYGKKKQWEFDFVTSMKHPQEYKERSGTRKPFVFGKLNSMSVLRASYGRQRVLADYINSLSVRVNLHYSLGVNVGLLKPIYYFEVNAEDPNEPVKFNSNKHFYATDFEGAAPWSKGLNEVGFRPGLSGKLALSFEWGKQDDRFKSLETGIMADVYGQRLPIMAFTDNDFAYINIYAALMIGNRW